MMGRTHAVSGIAAGLMLFGNVSLAHGPIGIGPVRLAAGTIRLGLGLGGMSAPYTALMCLVLACTALLPDLDAPSSLASTSLPPVTTRVSRCLAGPGHRTVTHTGAGIVAGFVLTAVPCLWAAAGGGVPVRPGNGLVLGLCAAMGARALGVGPRAGLLLWGAAVSGFLVGAAAPATAWWFMPVAVAVGMWVHRLGDSLTTRGVENLLWPLIRSPRLCLPVLGDTGSAREQIFAGALAVYCAWCGIDLLLAAV